MTSVFIVEDDYDMVDLFKKFCAVYGIRVLGSASTGAEAFEKIKTLSEPSITVVIDYHLPRQNGGVIASQLKDLDKNIDIIIISGDISIREQVLKSEGVEFLPKPFNMKNLMCKLSQV